MGLFWRNKKFCVRGDDCDPPSFYLTGRPDGEIVSDASGAALAFQGRVLTKIETLDDPTR